MIWLAILAAFLMGGTLGFFTCAILTTGKEYIYTSRVVDLDQLSFSETRSSRMSLIPAARRSDNE